MPEANHLLRAARERLPSPSLPGEHASRVEVAEAVNAWLWGTTGQRHHLDAHYLAKIERGVVRWPSAAYRAGIRHVLGGLNDAALGFHPPRRAGTNPLVVQPVILRPRGASFSEVDVMLVDTADESSKLLAQAEATNVGDMTIEQMHADVQRIAHSYLKEPTQPLFVRTRALRDRAFALLDGRQRPDQTRELWAAAGWSLTLLAWMTVDLGRPDVAENHARTAWACARNADNNGLRAWVCATRHTAAFWQEDYENAANYAADGLNYATGTAATFLASAYALDLARSGNLAQGREAVVKAQRIAEIADSSADDLGGPFTCRVERAEGFWSDAALSLGNPTLTAQQADAAVARFENTLPEQRNHGSERMVRMQQVKARLALGELDGAAEALDAVLATAPEHRVRPLVQRFREVRTAAAEYTSEPIADTMRDKVTAFIGHPGVPELTA